MALALSILNLSACTNPSSTAWQAEDQLRAADGQTWVVGSHLVTVPPDAAQRASPPIGTTLRVSGVRTARGELVIDTVEVINPPAALPQPTAPPPKRVAPTPQKAPTPVRSRKPHRDSNDADD